MSSELLVDLGAASAEVLEQAAMLLQTGFDEWASPTDAREAVAEVLDGGFALGVVEMGTLLGWVGGLVEYGGRVVELHPLVVRPDRRREGVGRRLVAALEDEARRRGAGTVMLGTDDDTGRTTLAGVDLYDDVPGRLASLAELGGGHPFVFYRALGYTVTGVVPDANGPGRPDILMAKRL